MYSREVNKPKDLQTASPTKYPNKYLKNKACRDCNNIFPPKSPSELYCSENCRRSGNINSYLKRVYGICLEDYNRMLEEQDNKCLICMTEGFVLKPCHKLKLVVDHCHKTGKVRGLLCHNCNRALGLLQDNQEFLARAQEYLKVQRLSLTGVHSSEWKR